MQRRGSGSLLKSSSTLLVGHIIHTSTRWCRHVAAVYQLCFTLDASSLLRPIRQALLLLSLIVFFTSCALAPSYRAHPSFSERFSRVKSVAVASGKIDVFYLDTSGLPEKRDEWSDQGRSNILAAIQAELQSKTGNHLLVKLQEQSKAESRDSLERLYALFEAVSQSIILHTYSPNTEYQFEDKIKNFEYSLGPEVNEIAGEDSDSLLLVTGRDHIWSEGRKALQTLGVIIGVGAGVASGVAVIPRLGGGTVLQAALVDARTGDLLWYKMTARGGGTDFRENASVVELVRDLFADFPPNRVAE